MTITYEVSCVIAMGKKNINQLSMENHSDKMKVPRSRNTTFLRHEEQELSFSSNNSVSNIE